MTFSPVNAAHLTPSYLDVASSAPLPLLASPAAAPSSSHESLAKWPEIDAFSSFIAAAAAATSSKSPSFDQKTTLEVINLMLLEGPRSLSATTPLLDMMERDLQLGEQQPPSTTAAAVAIDIMLKLNEFPDDLKPKAPRYTTFLLDRMAEDLGLGHDYQNLKDLQNPSSDSEAIEGATAVLEAARSSVVQQKRERRKQQLRESKRKFCLAHPEHKRENQRRRRLRQKQEKELQNAQHFSLLPPAAMAAAAASAPSTTSQVS